MCWTLSIVYIKFTKTNFIHHEALSWFWLCATIAQDDSVAFHPRFMLMNCEWSVIHYGDVIMSKMASLITSLTSVYSTVHSCADHREHQSSASLAFVRGIHQRPVNSPHKWPVTRKMFPFDDVIMHYKSEPRWITQIMFFYRQWRWLILS